MRGKKGALVAFLLWAGAAGLAWGQAPERATIYYNEACRACVEYIRGELVPLLTELGVGQVAWKDFINEPQNRAELVRRSGELGVPPKLQGHMTTFLDGRVVLEGHVPAQVIRDLVGAPPEAFERIVVFQDNMAGMDQEVSDYRVWAFAGPVRSYPISEPISTYLEAFAQRQEVEDQTPPERWSFKAWLPLILGTGLLDGVNPCAIAVLLFFIAFLFTIHRLRAEVFKVGLVYIAMIYLTYLAIGLGILRAIVLTDTPHFMAQAGSWLLIGLGLINVKDFFWHGRGVSLSPSARLQQASMGWLKKATLPATAVGGVLVGLCTFPCSGGVYVAVLGLLSAQTTYWAGLGYLLLYNAMFVVPLVALLLAVGNRRAVGRLLRWEANHQRAIKLSMGGSMVALGAAILLWFV